MRSPLSPDIGPPTAAPAAIELIRRIPLSIVNASRSDVAASVPITKLSCIPSVTPSATAPAPVAPATLLNMLDVADGLKNLLATKNSEKVSAAAYGTPAANAARRCDVPGTSLSAFSSISRYTSLTPVLRLFSDPAITAPVPAISFFSALDKASPARFLATASISFFLNAVLPNAPAIPPIAPVIGLPVEPVATRPPTKNAAIDSSKFGPCCARFAKNQSVTSPSANTSSVNVRWNGSLRLRSSCCCSITSRPYPLSVSESSASPRYAAPAPYNI